MKPNAGRVATRWVQAVGEVMVDSPPFRIAFAKVHAGTEDQVVEGLRKATQAFRKARINLRGSKPINVMVKGRGSAQRASYHSTGQGYIRLVPRTLRSPQMFQTLVHELGHYLHHQRTASGFGNQEIHSKFLEVMNLERDQGPRSVEDATLYEKKYKRLKKELDTLKRGKGVIRKGMTFHHEGAEGFSPQGPRYTREYKILKTLGKTSVLLEILNPSDWDKQVQPAGPPYLDTWPREVVVRALGGTNQSEIKRLESELAQIRRKWSEAAHALQESRYDTLHSDWVPTDYSRTNHKEWFAELVTAMVIKPANVPQHVKDWVLSQIQ